MRWLSMPANSFAFFSMHLSCIFSLHDFLLEAEAMAVNWTSKLETSMSKGTHVRKSVTVGDKEETCWHPRVMGKVNWSWASKMGNEDREIKQVIVRGSINVEWDFSSS